MLARGQASRRAGCCSMGARPEGGPPRREAMAVAAYRSGAGPADAPHPRRRPLEVGAVSSPSSPHDLLANLSCRLSGSCFAVWNHQLASGDRNHFGAPRLCMAAICPSTSFAGWAGLASRASCPNPWAIGIGIGVGGRSDADVAGRRTARNSHVRPSFR